VDVEAGKDAQLRQELLGELGSGAVGDGLQFWVRILTASVTAPGTWAELGP
jgi:hypothetical protein